MNTVNQTNIYYIYHNAPAHTNRRRIIRNPYHYRPMSMAEFLTHCNWVEGNMAATLFTGIIEAFPAVYETLPVGATFGMPELMYILTNLCNVVTSK